MIQFWSRLNLLIVVRVKYLGGSRTCGPCTLGAVSLPYLVKTCCLTICATCSKRCHCVNINVIAVTSLLNTGGGCYFMTSGVDTCGYFIIWVRVRVSYCLVWSYIGGFYRTGARARFVVRAGGVFYDKLWEWINISLCTKTCTVISIIGCFHFDEVVHMHAIMLTFEFYSLYQMLFGVIVQIMSRISLLCFILGKG